jgi:hypothetical protein
MFRLKGGIFYTFVIAMVLFSSSAVSNDLDVIENFSPLSQQNIKYYKFYTAGRTSRNRLQVWHFADDNESISISSRSDRCSQG